MQRIVMALWNRERSWLKITAREDMLEM